MQFQYTMSRKDYQNHLEETYNKTNIFYIVLFSLFYIIVSFNIIKDNFWLVFISYILYVLTLFIILYLVNRLFTYIVLKINDKVLGNSYGEYECLVNDDGIMETVNGKEYNVGWQDITKIKNSRKYIMIFSSKNKFVLLFRKNLFTNKDEYNKLIMLINENYVKNKKELEH